MIEGSLPNGQIGDSEDCWSTNAGLEAYRPFQSDHSPGESRIGVQDTKSDQY